MVDLAVTASRHGKLRQAYRFEREISYSVRGNKRFFLLTAALLIAETCNYSYHQDLLQFE